MASPRGATIVSRHGHQLADSEKRISEEGMNMRMFVTYPVLLSDLPLTASANSICESIVFERSLNSRKMQKVDTYLALRHGITLDQSTPASYIGSDGRTVCNAVANAEFSHHIFGIRNDTVSRFHTRENTSSEETALLKINADTLSPMSYVFLGDSKRSYKLIRE